MSRASLEKLREFAKRRIEGAQKKLERGAPSDKKFQQGRREMALSTIHEIDRLLAALPSEPTIAEAFEAGFTNGMSANASRPHFGNCADWLKQRSGK